MLGLINMATGHAIGVESTMSSFKTTFSGSLSSRKVESQKKRNYTQMQDIEYVYRLNSVTIG